MQPLASRPPLVDQVHRRLVPLRQEELAERLGVSRQPVSHALALLKQEGLLMEHGRRGLQVVPLDPGRLQATYQVRAALDRLAAQLAAGNPRRRSADAGRQAEAALLDGRRAVGQADAAAMIDADVAFHQAITDLAGNPVLQEIAARQWLHVRRAMGAVLSDPASRARVWDEHAAILAAVLEGRADEAGALAEAHALRAAAETAARLGQQRQVA